MANRSRAVLYAAFFFLPALLFADTITLKSGKKLTCSITEETKEYVKIEYNGAPLFYERKYIQSIEKGPLVIQAIDDSGLIQDADIYFEKGMELASKGEFQDAEKIFAEALKQNPSDYNTGGAIKLIKAMQNGDITQEYALLLFKGSRFLSRHNYEDAIKNLEEALKINPQDVDVIYNLGLAYYSIDNYDKAIGFFLEVARSNPEDIQAISLLGNAYYLSGQYQEARSNLIIARDLFQKSGEDKSAQEIDRLIQEMPPAAP